MLKPVIRLIGALNSNSRPGEIGFGIGAGVLLGLIPGANLTWYALLIVFFILRINLPAMFLTLALVKLFVPAADPVLHALGRTVLTNPSLDTFFAGLYGMPLVPFTHFNSTTVMGGFIAGTVLLVPLALLSSLMVRLYRKAVLPKIRNSKIVKNLKRIPVVSKIVSAAANASTGIRKH